MADNGERDIRSLLMQWPVIAVDPAEMDRAAARMVTGISQPAEATDDREPLFFFLTAGWVTFALAIGLTLPLTWPMLTDYLSGHLFLKWALILLAAACLLAPLLLLVLLPGRGRQPRLTHPGGSAW